MGNDLLAAGGLMADGSVAGFGAIAQLGERLICIQEVVGSIPSGSTNSLGVGDVAGGLACCSSKRFAGWRVLFRWFFVIVKRECIRSAARPGRHVCAASKNRVCSASKWSFCRCLSLPSGGHRS